MKTLNDQYQLIKEGKGHKGMFLTEAKRQFPNYVRTAASFNEAETILKQRGVINEGIVSLEPINNPFSTSKKESYEIAFEAFLSEAKKKENEDEKVKAIEKKPSKKVKEDADKNFDNTDEKIPDNMIFDQIMMGYYAEMKDPKNSEKTMQELKDIVFKNLAKDSIHYTKEGQFGVKDLGYSVDHPGLGEPKEAKGKYKASGYGDLNENLEQLKDELINNGYKMNVINNMSDESILKSIKNLINDKGGDEKLEKLYANALPKKEDITYESKLRKAIREMIDEEIKEIIKINPVKGGGGRRNIPSDITLSTNIIKRLDLSNPGPNAPSYNESIKIPHIKIATSKEGIPSLFISDFLDIALKGITRGRTTRETEVAKNTLQKMQGDITDKDWSMIRALIKKYSETKPISYPTGEGKTALYHKVNFPSDPTSLGDKFETGFSLDKTDNGLKINLPRQKSKEDTMESLMESVEKDLVQINKEAEREIISSKLEKVQALIDKKQTQISKLDEDEDMKALTDDKKVKEIQKDIKALEKAKAKLEKLAGKVKGKTKEVIDEMDELDENPEQMYFDMDSDY
jgi:hypothetical protein